MIVTERSETKDYFCRKPVKMETLHDTRTTKLIEAGLEKAMSYQEYRILVDELVAKNTTTGKDQAESLINYTLLNDRRMKRLDKTVRLSEAVEQKAASYDKKVTWLVLTESWCGDAAQTMPVMNKVAALNENIDLKVVLRDEHIELMDQFLTNGSRSIPKLIMLDTETNEVLGEYGPRPSIATKMVQDFKAGHGTLTPEFKQDLQVWYNKDKGQNTAEDLVEFLSK